MRLIRISQTRTHGQRTHGVAQPGRALHGLLTVRIVLCNPCSPYATYVDVGFSNPVEGLLVGCARAPLHIHAAIDAPHLTGDVGRLVRGEESYDPRNLLGTPEAT